MTFRVSLHLQEAGKEPRTVYSDLTPGDTLIMGRGQNVQLWVNDKNISREHCKVICENQKLYVEDLASRNGTFVDGERIKGRVELLSGQQIRLASTSSIQVSYQKNQAVATRPQRIQNTPVSSIPIDEVDRASTAQVTHKVARPSISGRVQTATIGSSNLNLPSREFSLVGETFNGYKVESRIGVGGMAIVYKGIQLGLGREVAIKTLSHRLIQNPKAIKRFLNVAKLSGQLSHPNIVQIYDSGSLDEFGIYYIVMEYVKGKSLNHILKDSSRLGLERACEIIGHLAGTLSYAHKRNIIHRDINPSNILIGEEDVPKIIGLGLSKSLDDEFSSLTQPGQSMGMVGYIAPEQLLDAAQADHRSDIYSLGAVFYRCVCGSTPYETKNMREYFNCIHNKVPPIPPQELCPEIPDQISYMILKALAHEADQRYGNIEEFISSLKSFLSPRQGEEGVQKARKQLMAMLPSRTSVPGLEFESIYKPCEEIGGDFYDFIELGNQKIGIVIGDVSGHGAEAAVVVGMIKATIKIFGKQFDETHNVMRQANKEIYPDLDATTFATAFYGVIDLNKRTLTFSRAGHNPLIIYNPNRKPKLQTFHPKGMVLGMFKKCECEEMTIPLEDNDYIIQYTDGITEAMNAEKEEFGLPLLCETIEQEKNNDLKEILQSIEQAVNKFTHNQPQEDDIALIGIKVLKR